MNNLKQFGVATHLVASDNNDVMPWANWLSGEDSSPTPQGWLYARDLTASGPAQFKVQTGSFWPTLASPKMYFCPSDNTNSVMFQLRPQQSSSYVMNGAVCGGALTNVVKLTQLSPSGVEFWECNNATEDDNQQLFNDGASSPDENTSGRHGNVAVISSFDGSAGLMQIVKWTEKMNEDGPNELWCYPGSPDGHFPLAQ